MLVIKLAGRVGAEAEEQVEDAEEAEEEACEAPCPAQQAPLSPNGGPSPS